MRIERAADLLRKNVEEGHEIGASLSIWRNGDELLNIGVGWQDRQKTVPWTAATRVLVWSASKGPAAATLLQCLHEKKIPLGTPVAELWPEFTANGKRSVTLAHILSHRGGVPALSEPTAAVDHDATAKSLASQAPAWPPGTAHGYHPRTFGPLLDELLRRLSGQSLRQVWESIAEPLGLDFHFGTDLPVAPVFPARIQAGATPTTPFAIAFSDRTSLTARAFASPCGFHSVASMNTAEGRAAGFPAFGGIGTASALAKFYSWLIGGVKGSLPPPPLAWMTTRLSNGEDLVLRVPTAFSAGFMLDPLSQDGTKLRSTFGPSLSAFGHPGAGGSLGFADPETGLTLGYTMNQMEPGVLPGERLGAIIQCLYE